MIDVSRKIASREKDRKCAGSTGNIGIQKTLQVSGEREVLKWSYRDNKSKINYSSIWEEINRDFNI